jgi:hypothetical protein
MANKVSKLSCRLKGEYKRAVQWSIELEKIGNGDDYKDQDKKGKEISGQK